MEITLPYGTDGELTLHFDADQSAKVAGRFLRPGSEPIDDPVAAVQAALVEPLEFPTLDRATVPEDRVVIALDAEVPQAPAVVAGVVSTLLEGHIRAEDIAVVCVESLADEDPRHPTSLLADDLRGVIPCHVHDPTDHAKMSYLAASDEAKAIYINREIVDADFVIPIGVLRSSLTPGYVGGDGGVFPAFSDDETQKRFHSATSVDSPVHHRRRCHEAEQAAWLLGVQFTIQLVPGPPGGILAALAGAHEPVLRRGQMLCETAWRCEMPYRSGLVIAALNGENQTWEDAARALSAAVRVVADQGAIVLLTDLAELPGPTLNRLSEADLAGDVLREIHHDRTHDAGAACQIAHVLEETRVYLVSRLDEETVEGLGMIHIEKPQQISNLARRHDDCIILGNAQYVVPSVAGELAQ